MMAVLRQEAGGGTAPLKAQRAAFMCTAIG
jgi:hypothetical protein